ncbi:hypothetical protein ERO13_A02G146000v2 [Gossypium hirsutum]|nr:hypothetical protein ERO13_A02G146000v2 [Gossypium hirsutum]
MPPHPSAIIRLLNYLKFLSLFKSFVYLIVIHEKDKNNPSSFQLAVSWCIFELSQKIIRKLKNIISILQIN